MNNIRARLAEALNEAAEEFEDEYDGDDDVLRGLESLDELDILDET